MLGDFDCKVSKLFRLLMHEREVVNERVVSAILLLLAY